MSRLGKLSPAAMRAIFSPDSDDTLVVLLTLSGSNLTQPIRLADNYNQRLFEDEDDIMYGIKSGGNDYWFLPFSIELPSEEEGTLNCSISIQDVTRKLLPEVRNLTTAPDVNIQVVLKSNPDVVEIEIGDFILYNISYNQGAITGSLTVMSYENEPFPSGSFTPGYFQGMF